MPDKNSFFDHLFNEWWSIAYTIIFSAFAGVVGYLNKANRTDTAIEIRRVFISFVIGGLNGYLMFMLCDYAMLSWQVTAFMTGSAGALGTEMLNSLTDKAKNFRKGRWL